MKNHSSYMFNSDSKLPKRLIQRQQKEQQKNLQAFCVSVCTITVIRVYE